MSLHWKESSYNVWVEHDGRWWVYNGVSGSLLPLSREERRALQAYLEPGGQPGQPPAPLAELARRRMVIPAALDEIAFLERRYQATRWDPSTFALTLVTSLGCNFDCPYCFQAKHPSIMTAEVEDAVLAAVDDQLPQRRRLSVTWYGGEPLVGKRPLLALSDRFIERCDRHGVEYAADITTNGHLLDESTCIELRERRVRHVQVNLDGPPAIHDRRRPLVGGGGTFWRIVENLHQAVPHLPVTVRVNLDEDNLPHVEDLLRILHGEGLAGRVRLYPAQVVPIREDPRAPAASYQACCLGSAAFARVERDVLALAARYGFASPTLPRPTGAPCTAVRAHELVVGSRGELYKCWDSAGNHNEVIGSILDYRDPNGRLRKWLSYNPFSNAECRSCLALPVCMGGCARHALDPLQYENRCGTFRHTHREQILAFVEAAGKEGPDVPPTVALDWRKETR